jgi:tetratricopeptide (TPR) repeat protein
MFRRSSDQSLALLTELLDDEPSRPDYRLELAIAWRNRANVARMINDPDMGKEAIATAIKHLDELARDFPDEPVYRFELADTLCIPASRNSDDEAASELMQRVRRAIVLCEDLIESYPNVTEYQALMGTSLSRQAILLHQQDNFAAASESFHQAIDLQQPLAVRFASVSLYQIAYLQSLWGLSEVSVKQNDPASAVGFLETAIDRLQILTTSTPQNRMLEHYLEKLRRRRGELTRPSAEETPTAAATAG